MTTSTSTPATTPDQTNLMEGPTLEPGLLESVQGWWDRVRSGDVGSLPAILGLLVLVALFSVLRPTSFPTAGNLANLLVQAAAIIVLAMGLVFVLLLGEIDLSAGVAGGVAAGVMAELFRSLGVSWFVAVPAALLAGMVIGVAIGLLVAVVGIPSFVVTLALFLALQGITLRLIGVGGTVPVNDPTVLAIANSNVPPAAGWVLAALVSVGLIGGGVLQWYGQRRRGVSRSNLTVLLVRAVTLSVIVLAVTAVLNENRARVATVDLSGIPYAVPLIGILLLVWSFVLGRTRYGRHIYAVGGNAEAARRAGISVRRIRVSVFVIGSGMAALSGIIYASRLNSVTPDAGAGNTLLYAVGAAVIGGTSLFGGKGKVTNAVIGGLVIAVIDNGLGLLGQSASVNYLVSGGVLLIAASVDAISRKRRASAG